MKAIVKPRAGGKTYELITKHFINTSSILIVMIEKERIDIIKEYNLTKEESNRIIPLCRLKNFIKTNTEPIIVDNVEYLLSTVLGQIPKLITFTGTSEE